MIKKRLSNAGRITKKQIEVGAESAFYADRVVSLQTDGESLPQEACFAFVSCICRKPFAKRRDKLVPFFIYRTTRLKSQRDEAIV